MGNEFVIAEDAVRELWEKPAVRFTRKLPDWAQRTVRLVLAWIGVEVAREIRVRQFVRPQDSDLFQRMHLNQSDMELLYNQKARYLFIGPDMMHEMDRELMQRSHMLSLGNPPLRVGGPHGVRTIMGVELVMVPWMEGALLVPEWRK
jgi:hypothetical protein